MENKFYEWMKNNTKLSQNSCKKYSRAIDSISSDMIEENVINKNLYLITSINEFNLVLNKILDNDDFNSKNKIGHNMYSRAINYYSEFLKAI